MSFEPDDIVAEMTRQELLLYRAQGGQLTALQQQRLLGRTMRVVEWNVPPASPGTLEPAADVRDLDRRVRDAMSVLCPGPRAVAAAAAAAEAPAPQSRLRSVFGPQWAHAPARPAAPARRGKYAPNQSPVECAENPELCFPSVTLAARALGVSWNFLARAVREGRPVKGRHWQRRRVAVVDEQGRRLAC